MFLQPAHGRNVSTLKPQACDLEILTKEIFRLGSRSDGLCYRFRAATHT